MRGEISLDSELGRGTKAVFSIPFNKPQFTTGSSSPLIDLGAIPARLQSEMSVSGCGSDVRHGSNTPPQSPSVEGLSVTADQRKGRSGSYPLSSPPLLGAEPDSSSQETDRQKVHVLVVEDK